MGSQNTLSFTKTRLPPDMRERWAALFGAIQRQESALSRYSRRLVTAAEKRAFGAFLRVHWNPLYTSVTTVGPTIRTDGDAHETMGFVMSMISSFLRAREMAQQAGYSLSEFVVADNAWLDLAYPERLPVAPPPHRW